MLARFHTYNFIRFEVICLKTKVLTRFKVISSFSITKPNIFNVDICMRHHHNNYHQAIKAPCTQK